MMVTSRYFGWFLLPDGDCNVTINAVSVKTSNTPIVDQEALVLLLEQLKVMAREVSNYRLRPLTHNSDMEYYQRQLAASRMRLIYALNNHHNRDIVSELERICYCGRYLLQSTTTNSSRGLKRALDDLEPRVQLFRKHFSLE